MSDDYSYRPKFMDIRVKPPADETSKAKAKQTRICDYEGCDLAGEYPAPMRFGDGKLWFCKRHAAEYNRNFNFFDTMTDEQVAAFNENARYGFKQTWKFGSGPSATKKPLRSGDARLWQGADIFHGNPENAKEARRSQRAATGIAKKALAELDLKPDAKPADIRARYADYVRRFHPDSNSGDRSSEEKLARVIRAGKTLKAAGLMKDA
ncbi:MAG: J domain-containing protein [Pseudomonadota bacterium]